MLIFSDINAWVKMLLFSFNIIGFRNKLFYKNTMWWSGDGMRWKLSWYRYTVVLLNYPFLHRVLYMVLEEYYGLTFVQWGPKD